MATTAKSHSITLVEARGEVHFAIAGFWDFEAMESFLDEINVAVLPLMKARRRIHALGDFGDFMPQDRQTGDAIRDHLMNARKFGLEKIAIVKASPLTQMQYKRLSDGLEVQFFDNQHDAAHWLRQG